jgi:hypothetical protein
MLPCKYGHKYQFALILGAKVWLAVALPAPDIGDLANDALGTNRADPVQPLRKDVTPGWECLEVLVDEAVAETDHGFDLPSGSAKLAAKATDVHVHRPRLHETIVAPDPLQQLVPRNHPIPVPNQVA